ncbi:hypothetical protein MASR2M79_08520 [Aminivibrio sp.]
MAAQVAAADPERAPKKADATTITCANPPRIQPTRQLAKRTILRDIPPISINLPASIKNGMAIKVKESTDTYILCARVAIFISEKNITTKVGRPIATINGILKKRNKTRRENKTIAVARAVISILPLPLSAKY